MHTYSYGLKSGSLEFVCGTDGKWKAKATPKCELGATPKPAAPPPTATLPPLPDLSSANNAAAACIKHARLEKVEGRKRLERVLSEY